MLFFFFFFFTGLHSERISTSRESHLCIRAPSGVNSTAAVDPPCAMFVFNLPPRLTSEKRAVDIRFKPLRRNRALLYAVRG